MIRVGLLLLLSVTGCVTHTKLDSNVVPPFPTLSRRVSRSAVVIPIMPKREYIDMVVMIPQRHVEVSFSHDLISWSAPITLIGNGKQLTIREYDTKIQSRFYRVIPSP